ncbi:protein GRAVITROPIC IN THE LIGHT 1-like [Rutidosis leptorrhynchoides]|uniref:protein GRAVITROPIC IN THE LIGHT 1-like n=1 Tax=Rutidosis leptorrhynchoides TaxID=125765 RepID=UPI003A98F72C
MEKQIKLKNSDIDSLNRRLLELNSVNKWFELKLNSSIRFPLIDHVDISDHDIRIFIDVLNYVLVSIQDFVTVMIREMQSTNWNIDQAVKSIEPNGVFDQSKYKCFVFESYVTREMFEGFGVKSDEDDKNGTDILEEDCTSSLAKFTRGKYMRLVHQKMEYSFNGNLGQRKMLNEWQFSLTTKFLGSFTEMARRVWILRCLALSFDEEVSVFRVSSGCRFSSVYIKNVVVNSSGGGGDWLPVAFTVVPGFKIGEKVVQSQVYLSPAGGSKNIA